MSSSIAHFATKAILTFSVLISMVTLSQASTRVGVDLNFGAPAGAPAPPPPVVENRWAPPYPTAVWVSGHYQWRHHHYVWYPGYYTYPAPVVVEERPVIYVHGHYH
jgi:hypothetical protein